VRLEFTFEGGMVSVDLLGGEGGPSEPSQSVCYGDVAYDQLPVPSDTWAPSLAQVPGDDGEGDEFDEDDMEARIRAKYQPSKLSALGDAPKPAAAHSAIPASYEPPTANPGTVYACAYCDGQGKVYKTIPLSNLGEKGTTRTIEACCQPCKGFGVINTLDKKLNEPEGPTARRPESEAHNAGAVMREVRLDRDDPPVDMEALLVAAGPSPFARGAPRKKATDLQEQD